MCYYVCCTYGAYCLSSFVSLSLHDLWSIVELQLIDPSMTVILHITTTHPCTYRSDNTTHLHNVCLANFFADAKHACLIVKNYDSRTEHTSCVIFADAKHACLIIKNYDSPTEHTFCEHFTRRKMRHASLARVEHGSDTEGPWPIIARSSHVRT